MAKKGRHSQAFLGKWRNFWWNRDFLDLMAKRWGLHKASSIADIGCGTGHWSRLLFKYLKPNAKLVGVDFEADYIKRAPIEFRRVYPKTSPAQYSFLVGDATHLPLTSNSFDVVTCQTLLIHLKDPKLALQEIIRVAKPGGLIICSEPNNEFASMEFSSLTPKKKTEDLVRYFEYILRYTRGKAALGEGDIWFGEFVPELFVKARLKDIKVYQSDQAYPLLPPYTTEEQAVSLKQLVEWKKQRTGGWDKKVSKQRVLAGGGSEKFFNAAWRMFERDFEAFQKTVKQESFYRAGGEISYLVSGKKAN